MTRALCHSGVGTVRRVVQVISPCAPAQKGAASKRVKSGAASKRMPSRMSGIKASFMRRSYTIHLKLYVCSLFFCCYSQFAAFASIAGAAGATTPRGSDSRHCILAHFRPGPSDTSKGSTDGKRRRLGCVCVKSTYPLKVYGVCFWKEQ